MYRRLKSEKQNNDKLNNWNTKLRALKHRVFITKYFALLTIFALLL